MYFIYIIFKWLLISQKVKCLIKIMEVFVLTTFDFDMT